MCRRSLVHLRIARIPWCLSCKVKVANSLSLSTESNLMFEVPQSLESALLLVHWSGFPNGYSPQVSRHQCWNCAHLKLFAILFVARRASCGFFSDQIELALDTHSHRNNSHLSVAGAVMPLCCSTQEVDENWFSHPPCARREDLCPEERSWHVVASLTKIIYSIVLHCPTLHRTEKS